MHMTTAKKLDSQKLLSQLVASKSSGCLELNNGEVYWQIYLQQGNLKYIYCSVQPIEQLEYYLRYLNLKEVVLPLKQWLKFYLDKQSTVARQKTNPDIYSKAISWLIKKRFLTLSQTAQLIQYITVDAFQSCSCLEKGIKKWYEGECMPQTRLGNSSPLNLLECLHREEVRLKQWQSCNTKLLCVHQRPFFVSDWKQKTLPLFGSLNYQALEQLSKVMVVRTSIRQLSLFFLRDEINIAQILSPYIDNNIIDLRNRRRVWHQFPTIPHSACNRQKLSSVVESRKIVCIDDSPTILQEIKRFLGQETLEITIVNEPTKAASQIFNIDPDLILLDINMPRINGYELCKLLRKSGKCEKTPIIMVTGNKGIIDKARAKIVGASDYFTKPFNQSDLIELVHKHLK